MKETNTKKLKFYVDILSSTNPDDWLDRFAAPRFAIAESPEQASKISELNEKFHEVDMTKPCYFII